MLASRVTVLDADRPVLLKTAISLDASGTFPPAQFAGVVQFPPVLTFQGRGVWAWASGRLSSVMAASTRAARTINRMDSGLKLALGMAGMRLLTGRGQSITYRHIIETPQ